MRIYVLLSVMLSPIRYVISLDGRSRLTVITIAIVIMFVTSTLVIVFSFENSNKELVDRFQSKYYVVVSSDNIMDSRVNARIKNATMVWMAPATINGTSTVIISVMDPTHLMGYGYTCKETQLIPGTALNLKKTANLSYEGRNYTLSVLGKKDLKFFPNYWAIVNISFFRGRAPNMLIVNHPVKVHGYMVLPMTVLTQFYAKTAEDVTFDLVLIDLITIVVVYLFINALLNVEIRDSVKKISIMRAIGSSRKNIGGIFLLRAIYIGTAGMIIGFSLGVILSYLLAAIIPLTGMLTYFNIVVPHLVFIVDLVVAVLGSFLAAIVPVKRAINIDILAGMKGVAR